MDDIRDAADVVTEESEKAKARVRTMADEAIRKGKEGFSDWKERSQDVLDEARERGGEALEEAQDLIRRYPAQAIGLGVLVGVLVGAFVIGRRED